MNISFVSNAGPYSGVGQRAWQIRRHLEQVSALDITDWEVDGSKGELRRGGEVVDQVRSWPGLLGSKSINWMRLGRKIALPGDSILHVTNQTLSFLAKRHSPSVITVHDIIELNDPQDRKAALLNWYLYGGMERAARIIAVSEYTKGQIVDYCGVSEERISVIYNGVDRRVFYPLDEVAREANLLLYVGSEHPRKNFGAVLEVLARVRAKGADARLIKVGGAGLSSARAESERELARLGLEDAVEWRESVSPTELNELYNRAGVLVFPSRYEGFGMPPLEAMSSGCPVVCSNATSLPEVVGSAAMTHDPDDVAGMAGSVLRLFNDGVFAETQIEKGYAQARKFSWDTAAANVLEVYKGLV